MRWAVLAAALAACGDDGPAPDPPWLAPYLDGVLAELAAAPRATVEERDAARAVLTARLAELGAAPAAQPYPTGANVVGTLPPTAGEAPAIVIGGHFDTVAGSPGANDNASGVAAVVAIARMVAETPDRTRPVIIALFDEEEQGLFGSRAAAAALAGREIAAVYTIDQVGWDGDGDRVFELEQPAVELVAAWRDAADAVGARITVTATGNTDHVSFRDRGYAAAGLSEEYTSGDTSPHRHQPSDTPGTIDRAYLALAARLAGRVVVDAITP